MPGLEINFSRASQLGRCADGLAQEIARGSVLQEMIAAITTDVVNDVVGAGEGCRENDLLL